MSEFKVCPKCGNSHSKSGKFCSRSCANSRTFSEETNAKRSKSNRDYMLSLNKTKYRTCIKCKEPFSPIRYGKICSVCKPPSVGKPKIKERSTITQTPIERTISMVESGELKKHSEVSIRRHMKRYLLHKNGNTCSICSTSVWFGVPVPLVCDHIDGDSTNSDINNFRLVCCNCDALLDTFKSKNKGKGRKYDREYKRNKSK